MVRVLVIDDCPDFRARVRRIAQTQRRRVLEAADVLAGLQRAVEDAPDLILIAHALSGLDGLAACEQIAEDPASRAIPILLISDGDPAAVEGRARRAGAVGVIPRSIGDPALLARIRSAPALATATRAEGSASRSPNAGRAFF